MQPRNTFLVVAVFLLFTPAAAGFGYLQGADSTGAAPGDEVHFKLYLFGTDESVKITQTDAPDGWDVNVDRQHVQFPVDDGFRYMETDDGYRKVVPVTVTATVPSNATDGPHDVTVVFTGQADDDRGGGVAVNQLQDVTFTVDVTGGAQSAMAAVTDRSERTGGATGMTITAGNDLESTSTDDTARPVWQNPVVLFLLFEITWGVAIIYLWKRRR